MKCEMLNNKVQKAYDKTNQEICTFWKKILESVFNEHLVTIRRKGPG